MPFRRAGQYELHRRTIERRRELGYAAAAVMDDDFTADLHATLLAWGIGRRQSRLVPLEVFRARLRAHHGVLGAFDGLVLEDLSSGQVGRLTLHVARLIAQFGVVENEARIVAGTKTLHHILPDLVPPMDRAWTGAFVGWTDMDLHAARNVADVTPGSAVVMGSPIGNYLAKVLAWDFECPTKTRSWCSNSSR